MTAVGLALAASLMFGVSSVLIHRALRGVDPFTGLVIDLTFNSLLLWVFLLGVHGLSELFAPVNLIFVGAGLLVPGLFRFMAFKGIEQLGASVSTTVLNSSPLFAVLMAMAILDERPGLINLLGAVSVVGGLTSLSWRGDTRAWHARDLVFPLAAALLAALRDNVVRLGLLEGPAPLMGATIASTTSAVTMGLVYFPRFGLRRFAASDATGLRCFAGTGCIHFIAYIAMFTALGMGRVSIVSPLVHCFSLFTLVLSHFFLRDADALTPRKVLATLLVVLGVVLISFSGR